LKADFKFRWSSGKLSLSNIFLKLRLLSLILEAERREDTSAALFRPLLVRGKSHSLQAVAAEFNSPPHDPRVTFVSKKDGNQADAGV